MKTRILTKTIPLFASTLLFAACSQQQSSLDANAAIPEAGGGVKAGGLIANSDSGNRGSNTQGVNTGNGAGSRSRSTGSGGGYQTGGQGNTPYYDYGKGNGSGNKDKEYTLANLKNPNSLLSKRIIYFDYNQASIKPQYQAILDAHAKLLAKNTNVDIRLEGHADERGTREYNVALSEERAKAVQWIMRGKGVKGSQSEVIAYGEERPAVVSDGEKSWAKNRRVEIKYPGR